VDDSGHLMAALDTYVQQNRSLLETVVPGLVDIIRPFRRRPMDQTDTAGLFSALYGSVWAAHRQAGELARTYYDNERAERTGLDPVPLYLAQYERDWALEALLPPLVNLQRATSRVEEYGETPRIIGASNSVVGAAVTEIRAGGRHTIRRGIEADPVALGWARVETGGSSCPFCTIQISRGPVFKSEGEPDNTFHLGCDCRAVPVFDENWPGRDQYLAAEEAVRAASRKARREGITLQKALQENNS
jgi:hypothetical protein